MLSACKKTLLFACDFLVHLSGQETYVTEAQNRGNVKRNIKEVGLFD